MASKVLTGAEIIAPQARGARGNHMTPPPLPLLQYRCHSHYYLDKIMSPQLFCGLLIIVDYCRIHLKPYF